MYTYSYTYTHMHRLTLKNPAIDNPVPSDFQNGLRIALQIHRFGASLLSGLAVLRSKAVGSRLRERTGTPALSLSFYSHILIAVCV